MLVVDLMSGMGECWSFIRQRVAGSAKVIAIDLSSEMVRRAEVNRPRFPELTIEVRQGDALDTGLNAAEADCVVACFALKTLSPRQTSALSAEVWRLLKPGGVYSFVEITVPPSVVLRLPYLFYLRYVIPLLGRIFLGNPDNYRMLAVYTESFGRGDRAVRSFEQQGFTVKVDELFFGCARRITGIKPNRSRMTQGV